MNARFFLSLATLLALSFGRAEAQTTWYVDDDAPAGGDGLSWATAVNNPGDALALAASGDEVRVGAGSYRPDQALAATAGDRDATFLLGTTVLQGGYQGLVGPESPDEYDPVTHVTVLDGDLLGDDLPGFVNYGDNSLHVVTASFTGTAGSLIGFTIRHGNADVNDIPEGAGGAVLATNSSVRILDCMFVENHCERWGAAIYVSHGSPLIQGCRFENNRSEEDGGAIVLFSTPASALVRDCQFIDNFTVLEGGSIHVSEGSLQVVLSTFEGGDARQGGAIEHFGAGTLTLQLCEIRDCHTWMTGGAISSGSLTMKDCLVEGCTAGDNKGGGVIVGGATLVLEDSVFADNEVPNVGGSTGGGVYSSAFDATVTGCEFRGNSAGRAGGLYLSEVTVGTITDCLFRENASILGNGGGLDMGDGSIVGCTFDRNTSNKHGAAINLPLIAITTLRANTIVNNESLFGDGGGLYVSTVAVLRDCILWGNKDTGGQDYTAQVHVFSAGPIDHDYSCIEGWDPLDGGFFMTADDPRLWNAAGGDYHLRSDSPCIDTGDPASPLDGDGSIADMGALTFDSAHLGSLASFDESISLSAGGTQAFSLDADSAHAGELYQILGTLTGSTPGFPLGGFLVPLSIDPYFLYTLNHPNQDPLTDSLAFLDVDGLASGAFSLPADSSTSLIGVPLNHAFGVLDPITFELKHVSNALALEVLP